MNIATIIGMVGLVAIPASPAAAAAPEPVQVMVLGVYHFGNPGLDLNNAKADDVTQPKRQAELESLAGALAAFHPTKIMIESQPKSPDLVDPGFAAFSPADLGRNRNEIAQIGYRLAHRLKLDRVYGIDEQPDPGEPDYFPFDKVVAFAKGHGREAELATIMGGGAAISNGIEEMQKTKTIAQILTERNRPETTRREMGLYYGVLPIGDTDQQPGADLNGMWYLRNAKIFAKLMTVARPGDRVLVIYGAGHNYWLRHFAELTPGYMNVDPVPYLEKARR